jgi:hypothetical protein
MQLALLTFSPQVAHESAQFRTQLDVKTGRWLGVGREKIASRGAADFVR